MRWRCAGGWAWLCTALCLACKAPAPPATNPHGPTRAERLSRQVELTETGLQNAEIRWAPLFPQTFSPHLNATATIAADPQAIARVGARMAGRVGAIRVRVGDTVKLDQPLVEIDTVELHHVSTEYLMALARAREANDALARQKQLVAERVGALQDLRRAEAAQEVTEANLRETEEHLHFLGLDDSTVDALRSNTQSGPLRSVLRAPIAGRVEALGVSLGQVLTGTEDVLTIMQLKQVWAVLRIYEHDLGAISTEAPVEVSTVGYPGRVFHGRVDAIGDLVETTTRTVEVRVAIDNQDGALKPGMTATAAVSIKAQEATLWLPLEAVQASHGQKVVFVKTGERHFLARPVTLGAERGGYVHLVSGVQAGENVVIHGAFTLRGELERSELEED